MAKTSIYEGGSFTLMKRAIISFALLAVAISATQAEVNFGSNARSVAMGGAGLALVGDPIVSGAINPAAYAIKASKFRYMLPSFDYKFDGTSLSKLTDISNSVDNSSSSSIELARELGKRNTLIELSGTTGFSLGRVVVMFDGQANADIMPSAGFKQWAADPNAVDWSGYVDSETGAPDLAAIQSNFYSDVTGQIVSSLPSIGYGWKVKGHKGVNLGVRVKAMRSSVRRQRITVSNAVNNGTLENPDVSLTLDAFTLEGVNELVQDTGIGMDFGLIYQTPDPNLQLTTAVIVNNLLEPSLDAVRVDRMLSFGATATLKNSVIVAADLVNINQAYDKNMQLRLGAEIRPFKWLAFRAGYGDGTPTLGIGLKGYDFAFSKDQPLTLGRLWKF